MICKKISFVYIVTYQKGYEIADKMLVQVEVVRVF